MANYVFGIDVGGTSVKCGLFQTDGTLLEKWEIPTRTENGGSEILPDIAKSVKAKMAEKGIAADDVAGVGIDVPGPVNDKGELSIAVNLNWGYKNIVKELSDELGGMAVKAANDANAAALGEMWAGGGKGSKNLVMVTLGTGVGGGIIVDGKIVAGAHGAGGEVGHACVDPEEEAVCNCGNHGCLEQMTSATGIVRLAKKYLASHDTPSSLRERGESISAKAVFDALKEGDAAAEAIVQEFSEYLGRALAVFACVVDPEVIVVGGGVSKAGQILIDGIDIRKIKISSLRRHFGQMLQDVFLFSGTIRSNIVLREEGIPDSEIMEVCRYVNADKFIAKLDHGLDEEVRERGNNFSAGQRQLLSFARTILHKPSVMILDEATANIDTETELLIQDSLEKMRSVGTMLIVAHRLSTIQHADNIIVLSRGRILEQGTHQQLLAAHGRYYQLYTLQYHKEQMDKQ